MPSSHYSGGMYPRALFLEPFIPFKNAGLKKYSALASDGDSNPAIAIATGVRDVKENVLKISEVLRFISFPCSKC